MNDAQIVDVLRQAAWTGLMVAGPLLAMSLIVGIGVSILQTITQIQEQAVAFVAKLGAVCVVVLIIGAWQLQRIEELIVSLWTMIPGMG